LDYSYPELKLRAKVSAGTYIRSIAFDLWQAVWTGWYVSYLRRTKIWKLDLNQSNSLWELNKFKFLDEKLLFWEDMFISLDDFNISRINDWLTRNIKLDLASWNYFLEDSGKITNVINYNEGIITPIRKIL
jgi:tRNA U55 pseudouridine synthase TruB